VFRRLAFPRLGEVTLDPTGESVLGRFSGQFVWPLGCICLRQHGQHTPRAAAQDSLPPFAERPGVCFRNVCPGRRRSA
jgi:hypothetical protein